VYWRSAEQTRQRIEQLAADYIAECRTLFLTLGVAPLDEETIRTKIHIKVFDQRRVKTSPIPVPGGAIRIVQ
jgi:hypothetical protein